MHTINTQITFNTNVHYHAESGKIPTGIFTAFSRSYFWAHVTWDKQSQGDLLINKNVSQWKQLGYDWIQQECWLSMYVWLMLIRWRRCELNWILICVCGVAYAIKGDSLAGNDSWVAAMLNVIPWFSTSSVQTQWGILINSRKEMAASGALSGHYLPDVCGWNNWLKS